MGPKVRSNSRGMKKTEPSPCLSFDGASSWKGFFSKFFSYARTQLPETALISLNDAKQSTDESLDVWANTVLALA